MKQSTGRESLCRSNPEPVARTLLSACSGHESFHLGDPKRVHTRIQPPGRSRRDPRFHESESIRHLVSDADGIPFATHLPLLVHETGEQIVVEGHMAKANPHWKSMKEEGKSLVIFHGPHAYVSPSLYEIRESVPTWNYAAVHVYGEATLFTDEDGPKGNAAADDQHFRIVLHDAMVRAE